MRDEHPAADGPHVLEISRRSLLKSSAGMAALFLVGDLAGAGSAAAAPATVGPPFFVYGVPDPPSSGSLFVGSTRSTPLATSSVASAVATGLAAMPVKSQDGSTLALLHVTISGSTVGVAATAIATQPVGIAAQGAFSVPSATPDSYVLVTPAVTPSGSTLAIAISVSVPENWRTIRKFDPLTGQSASMQTADWTTHHELAYFDCRTGAVTGPFDLADAPTLARLTAVASESDLFLWTMPDPTAPGTPGVPVDAAAGPTIAAYPLGEGTQRFTQPAPGPWPVNGEPVLSLETGDFVRFIYANALEVYSAANGAASTLPIGALDPTSAKQAAPTMSYRPDGTVFLANPVVGRAAVIDPTRGFATTQTMSYPVPLNAGGAGPKAALSAGGQILFTVAPARVGGLTAYDVADGRITGAYSDSTEYVSVTPLPNGDVLATTAAEPRLRVFNSALELQRTQECPCAVVAVF